MNHHGDVRSDGVSSAADAAGYKTHHILHLFTILFHFTLSELETVDWCGFLIFF